TTDLLPDQPVPHTSRPALFCSSGGVRPHPVGGPARRWPRMLCLFPLWRRSAPVSRRRVCVDGRPPGADDRGSDVAPATAPRPPCGALGAGDAATESGHSRAPRTTVTARGFMEKGATQHARFHKGIDDLSGLFGDGECDRLHGLWATTRC